MKKILFYTASLYKGGAQRVISILINSLVNEYEVGIITDIYPSLNRKEYFIDSKAKRYYLADSAKPINSLFRIRKIRQIIKTENPDYVVSFLGSPNIRNILASAGLKAKTIVSIRNDPNREYGHGIRRWVTNLLFRHANMCVFQTEDAKKYFSLLKKSHCVVIPNPIDNNFFNALWKGEKKQIAVIGRLEEQKNPKLALDAFTIISKRYPDFSLHFYGIGSLREHLEEHSKVLGINDSIFFHGEIENVVEVLRDAYIYILPSNYEGMPNSLMEALAVGVPCISTDCPCGGPRYLIENNVNGILVPCNDKNALTEAMIGIIESEELRETLAKEAKKKSNVFRIENIIAQWKSMVFI